MVILEVKTLDNITVQGVTKILRSIRYTNEVLGKPYKMRT